MAGSIWPATGTTPGQDANAVYALGSSPAESARLQRQADELVRWPPTFTGLVMRL